MDDKIRLSLVIPAKDKNDPKLQELLRSIERQDFPKDEMETLVITEGTSESAKAIGIRKAKGEVIGILASDNELMQESFLKIHHAYADKYGAAYPVRYFHKKDDDVLNRYFSLMGGNDLLCLYMRKNDRYAYFNSGARLRGSIGDNGFFIKKSLIEKTDLDNYYHIDNAIEAVNADNIVPISDHPIWHKTGGNIFFFFLKRYRYGLQHAFNKNRRWHLVDFRKPKDIWRLTWFVLATITIIQPLTLSIRGWLRIRDKAWFLHPVVCLGTLFTYTVLMMHLGLRSLTRSLSAPMAARRA
jgi:hypothetical protein